MALEGGTNFRSTITCLYLNFSSLTLFPGSSLGTAAGRCAARSGWQFHACLTQQHSLTDLHGSLQLPCHVPSPVSFTDRLVSFSLLILLTCFSFATCCLAVLFFASCSTELLRCPNCCGSCQCNRKVGQN